jgi:hypothetical protein
MWSQKVVEVYEMEDFIDIENVITEGENERGLVEIVF